MPRYRLGLVVVLFLAANGVSQADDWPVQRGPSHEPNPYRYDPKVLKAIPKEFLDDSAACVLYSGTTHLIEPDGTVEAISHEITRLNSRKGIEKLGEYRSISYDPAYEKLTLNEARVIKANGKIVPIEPKHVQLRDVATDFQVYDQDKILVISFPNLEVGDSYEVKWTVRGKNREFDGHFFSRYSFGDDTHPTLRDEFRVQVPKNKTLKHTTVNGKVDLKVSDNDAGKLYFWSVNNRAELSRDEDRPSREELRLQVFVSTFPSWEAVAQWKQKLRAECWTCTDEVRKTIADVTRGLKTPEEKAKALTYWVRRHVRYLSRGPGGLGYTPHLPHQVLSNLYGDCKDQAQLLAVMLREIGLPVWLVTLGTLDDGQIIPEVPSPWGSHAILLTQINGKDYWIDTTVSLAAWDFLPRADRDRQTYVTREGELKLLKTPAFTYKDYRIEQTTQVTIQPDGTTLCKRDATYHGSSAWTRRDRWLEVPPGERRRNVVAELQDAHSKAKLLALKIDDKQMLEFDRPVRAEMEFEVPKHFAGDATREGSLSDSTVWTWFLGYNLDVERKLPYVLPTPFESIHRYVVKLPEAYRLESLPESRDIRSPWGFYQLKVTPDAADPRRFELHMHMRLEKTRVEVQDFAEFQAFQDDVNRSYRVWFNLRPTVNIADAPLLEKFLANQKTGDPVSAKILAKLYLDYDRAAEARRVLARATLLSADDKGLWELRVQAAADGAEEEKLYRAMVGQFPAEPKFAVALGAAYVRRQQHEEAHKILTPLANNAPPLIRAAAQYQLARSALQQNNAVLALKHLQAALLTDSASLATIEALRFKAQVHESLSQLKDAINAMLAAVDADPSARDAWEYLVRLELKAGMRESALEHLRRYAVASAKDAVHLTKAADLYLQLQRFDEALELATQAKSARVLASVYFARRDYAKAVEQLERAPQDARSSALLIQAQLHLGNLDAAHRSAEAIRRLENAGKELFTLEKDLAVLMDRRDKLLAPWPAAKNRQAEAARLIGCYLCAERGMSERWPRAEIEALVERAPAAGLDFAPLLALRALLTLEKGQIRKAIADADAALKLQPNEARAHLVRGRARLEQGNITAALIDLRKATELSKREDATVLHWFASALLDAGHFKEAVETQRLAALLQPNDAEIQEQLRRMESAQAKEAAGIMR